MTPAFRISITANLVLAGVTAALLWRVHPGATPRGTDASQPLTVRAVVHEAKEADADLRPSPDGPQLTPAGVAALERLGIAREAIVNALINDQTFRHDKQVRAAEKRYAPRPVPRAERIKLQREAEAERVRELKQALGEDRYLAWDKENTLRMLNIGGVRLDAQDADNAYRVQKEFDEKNKALQMAVEDGITDEADFNTLYEKARQQYDRQLEDLFGKDRLAAMRGTPDPIADVTRRYEDLNPTAEQAKAVLKAEGDLQARESALAEQLKDNPEDSATLTAQLKALADAREENLRHIFGAETYDATTRQNDSTYQKLTQFAGAWNLQDSQIEPVYQALSAFHDQADLARTAAEMNESAGQPVDWHQVNAGIEQAREKTEIALANLIGGERVRRLMQNGLLNVR